MMGSIRPSHAVDAARCVGSRAFVVWIIRIGLEGSYVEPTDRWDDEQMLDRVLRRGWDERLRAAFIDYYGTLIRRSILYHVRRTLGGQHLRAVGEHLVALQEGKHEPKTSGIEINVLRVAADTWQDVLLRCLQNEDHLLSQWSEYVHGHDAAEGSARDFETYLKGAIGNTYWGHLRRRRAQLGDVVPLENLEETLAAVDSEASRVPVTSEILVAWDLLLRCQCPDSRQIEEEIVRLREDPESVLLWACASLKQTHTEKRKQAALDNLMAIATFLCSRSGPKKDEVHFPTPATLTLEAVCGQYYRWEEDVCKRIFEKQLRKDRALQQLQRHILSSPYRRQVQEVTS